MKKVKKIPDKPNIKLKINEKYEIYTCDYFQ